MRRCHEIEGTPYNVLKGVVPFFSVGWSRSRTSGSASLRGPASRKRLCMMVGVLGQADYSARA